MGSSTSTLFDDFRSMARSLAAAVDLPDIAEIFLPPLFKGGQPHDSEFMALRLGDDSVGISYVLLPEDCRPSYEKLRAEPFASCSPAELAVRFGTADPIEHMLALAALNAMCSHVIRAKHMPLDTATDSLGLLNIQSGDHIGMVGFFRPLIQRIADCGARLTVIELDDSYRKRYPDIHITLDTAELKHCNKVLCTSTTIYNNTLDSILNHCSRDAFVSVIGPTAGFFPEPLFDRGVDVVGGTLIHEGKLFMHLLNEKQRWTGARRKICFQKKTYSAITL
jgi:uncharacterized protein (DUF4213/DUF364 family)